MRDLPAGWEWSTVGELCDLVRGVSFKKGESSSSALPGTLPIIRAGNLSDGGIDFDNDLVWVPEERVSADQRLRQGDIVVATSSGSIKVVGKSVHLRTDWNGAHGAFMSVLRPTAHIDAAFAGWYVRSPVVREQWSDLAKGTNINNLKKGHLEDTRIPVPPLHEQRRIVAAIEEHRSRLNAAEVGLNRGRQRLGTLSDSAWLGVAEDDWPRSRLSDVLLKRDGRVLRQGWSPKCLKTPSPDDDTWGVLKTSAVQFRAFDPSANKELPRSLSAKPELEVLDGDMVMTSGGPRSRIGVTCIARSPRPKLMLCDKMFRFRPDPSCLDPEFLLMHLTSPEGLRDIEEIKTGSSDSGLRISQGAFEGLMVPVPPLDAQTEIVQRASEVSSQVKAVHGALDASMRRSAALRRSILAAAFSGHLVPQDPSDEPASMLLERIGAERPASRPSRKKKAAS